MNLVHRGGSRNSDLGLRSCPIHSVVAKKLISASITAFETTKEQEM